MINFRYHIVSLMAVFLALAVGIVLGVTLVSGEANKGLAAQAEQDRRQVQVYRTQLEQQQALSQYRDRWDGQMQGSLIENMLMGQSVAIVAMPGAPSKTVADLRTAVNDAGGTVTATANVTSNVFDATKNETTIASIDQFRQFFNPQSAVSTKVGMLLGHALLSAQGGSTDATQKKMRSVLSDARLAQIDNDSQAQAEVLIIVSATATDPSPGLDTLVQHVEFDLALKQSGRATVLAGPNSSGVDGTDVAQARQEPDSRDTLSTVDVADLPSGVATVIMAAKQQLANGGQGHYGAAASADAPAPQLPIR